MMRRWLLLAALAIPAVATSQQPGAAAERIPAVGTRVRVRAEGILAGRQTATILRRSGDTLTLAIKGDDPVAVPLSRMSSLDTSLGTSRVRGMIRGAVVVGAVGAGIAILNGRLGPENCYSLSCIPKDDASFHRRASVGAILTGVAIGGAFGAFFGSFWKSERWQPVSLAPRVSLGVAPSGLMTAGLTMSLP